MELNMMDWGLFNKHTQREESMDERLIYGFLALII